MLVSILRTVSVVETTDEQRRAFSAAVESRLIGRTVTDLAAAMGLEHERLRSYVRGKKEPPRWIAFGMETALGADPGELTRHLGYLPVSAAPAVTVEEAIRADGRLSATAKRTLLASYRDFTRTAGRG